MEFYGGYQVYSESGVDLTLLKDRLRVTVTERWNRNFEALKLVDAFREAGRARRAESHSAAERPPDEFVVIGQSFVDRWFDCSQKAAGRSKDRDYLRELEELKKLRDAGR